MSGIEVVGICEWQDCGYYGRERDDDTVLCGKHKGRVADPPEWNSDYVKIMADWLVGFESYPDWYQEPVWEMRECVIGSTKRAIRRCASLG